jgi:hypothetical protein
MEFSRRRKYYNLCRDEPLDPDDSRNVNLDAEPGLQARGTAWVDRLAAPIELSEVPTLTLVSGLRGSGKSTELRRLRQRLQDPKRAHLCVALIDAEVGIDLTQPVDVPDILMVVVSEAEREILRLEGDHPDRALQDGYLVRFWRWLTETEVGLKEAKFSVPNSGAELTLEMKSRPDLRAQIRAATVARLPHFRDQVRKELNLLDARARGLGWRGLAVIVDSLEKLRGTTENWEEVLRSAERTFAGGAPYLQLPVPVLYTVPPPLLLREPELVEFLPMIKVRERRGARSETGCRAIRRLVEARIDESGLRELLGDEMEARLVRLAEQTGGYPRQLFQALRWLLEQNRFPVEEVALERHFQELQDRYQLALTGEDLDWLKAVAAEQSLTCESPAQQVRASWALTNNTVMRYANTEVWHDLHPAVRALEQIRKRLAASPTG